MTDSLIVRKVETRADFRTLVRFPWMLYKGDPYWVPPLVASHRNKLSKRKNPTWQHLEGDYFIAWRGDQPVGTIAAFINHRHNSYHHEAMGFFGVFDVFDDQEAANALLDTAAHYLEARGCQAIRGPVTFSLNDEAGVLVKGFDDIPVLVMPYNYPYYHCLLDHAPGYHRVMNLYSYTITLESALESKKIDQLLRVTRRNNERRQITVRAVDPKHIKQDLEIVKSIYNTVWDNNWGFVPLSDSELEAMVQDIRRYLDPRLTIIAEVRGEPAAFLMAFPDINQPMRYAYAHPGKPDILSMMQMWWHWKLRSKINRIRIPLMGVQAEFRGLGVEAAMFAELIDQAKGIAREMGWSHADAGWVLEANEGMQRLVEGYNVEDYKQYCLYERVLSPTHPIRPQPPVRRSRRSQWQHTIKTRSLQSRRVVTTTVTTTIRRRKLVSQTFKSRQIVPHVIRRNAHLPRAIKQRAARVPFPVWRGRDDD